MTHHRRAVDVHGGVNSAKIPPEVENLAEYVEDTAMRYEFDEIETIALAAYQIVKKHPFVDGNKRTAELLTHNCFRRVTMKFTGRHKDLALQIIELATSDPSKKEESIRLLAYFLKRNLARYKMLGVL